MAFSEKQKAVIRHFNQEQTRLTICEGAVRSGKNYVNNFLWFMHVGKMAKYNVLFMMTGHTISSLKRNVLDELGPYDITKWRFFHYIDIEPRIGNIQGRLHAGNTAADNHNGSLRRLSKFRRSHNCTPALIDGSESGSK